MVLIARLLLGLQILVVMAAIGACVAFFGAIGLGLLFGASNMEGGLAMGAAGLMPIGGLVGAGLGLWLAWRLIRKLPPRATMLAGFGMAVLIAAVVAAWFIYDELSDGTPYRIGYARPPSNSLGAIFLVLTAHYSAEHRR